MTKLSTAHTDAFNYSVTKETATGGVAGDYDVAAGGANGGGSDNPQGAGGIGAMASGEIYLAAGATIEIGGGRGRSTLGGTVAKVPAALDALTRNAPSTASVTADILAGGSAKTLGSTGQIETFGYTGKIETFTAQTAGYYDITAAGAQGGGVAGGGGGGLGAFASGDIYLQANAILDIVVGGVGGTSSSITGSGGGGGGGSFVIEANNGSGAVDVNEVIAGGGGGGGNSPRGGAGQAGKTGGAGGGILGRAGGVDGAAGNGGYLTGGGGFTGGGFGANGRVPTGLSGATFAGGFRGLYGLNSGGFGGGGGGGGIGGSSGGGGGGGYGGGGGGGLGGGGGGGGSYVNPSAAATPNDTTAGGVNSGSGFVTIMALTPPTIAVASPAAHSTIGTTPVDPFAGDVIGDANFSASTEILTVTPSSTANGVLVDPNAATDHSSYNAATGVFTVFGTAGAVTTALQNLAFDPNAGAVGQTTTFTISDLSPAYPVAVTDSSTTVTDAPCYCRGTRILTERGEIAVEALRVGDLAITAAGARRPIVWLGHRAIDLPPHAHPDAVRPVRVAAGAFADNAPHRDLWLSPGHNVACEGALMPISALLNGRSVDQVDQERVEYWHVELDAHDVIFAEGLPAESYLDTGNRTHFANGGAFVEAHPDFLPRHWADTCLPLVLEGPAVAATKARLLARLAAQGFEVTQEADAHVGFDGVRIEPMRLSATRLAFALPAEGRDISLRSRHFTPAHTVAQSNDPRTLGLCVARLQIDGSEVSLQRDVAGMSGWHEAEYEREAFAHRWTTGATSLPAGVRLVIVDLAGVGFYWRDTQDQLVAHLVTETAAIHGKDAFRLSDRKMRLHDGPVRSPPPPPRHRRDQEPEQASA